MQDRFVGSYVGVGSLSLNCRLMNLKKADLALKYVLMLFSKNSLYASPLKIRSHADFYPSPYHNGDTLGYKFHSK